MRDRRLAHVAARGEVARTHFGDVGELPQDRESGRIGRGLEEPHVRVGLTFHPATVLTDVYIVKYQYTTRTATEAGAIQP